jgi:predicted regulator of Ras-like GTPase activity (Roadblock/LC7/MglB family)
LAFETLLRTLVDQVEGADGAIFLDSDGEAVQWYARGDGDLLRLRAAYLAVSQQSCRASSARLGLGHILYLVVEYDGAWFVIEELHGGYFFILQLAPGANLAQALDCLGPAVVALREEIAA